MAKISGPFLSISASGQIGKTLVATKWKGIKVQRQFVIPSNPRTPAQTAQRDRVSVITNAWRQFITPANVREAWNLMASIQSRPQSGFNWFTSNAVKNIKTDTNASYADFIRFDPGQIITVGMINVDDGAEGDEAGNFTILAGDSLNGLTFFKNEPIFLGFINIFDPLNAGKIRFYSIQKDGFERVGVIRGLVL